MIPNLKTDIIEFGKTLVQIGCILLAFFALCYVVLMLIGPVQGPRREAPVSSSITTEAVLP